MLAVGKLSPAACVAQIDDHGTGLCFGFCTDLLGQIALEKSGYLCAVLSKKGRVNIRRRGLEVKLAASHTLNSTCHHLLQHLFLRA